MAASFADVIVGRHFGIDQVENGDHTRPVKGRNFSVFLRRKGDSKTGSLLFGVVPTGFAIIISRVSRPIVGAALTTTFK